MAQNITPVVLKVKDFVDREVMMVDYQFDQATDVEGQLAGIPRGGRITVRCKVLNDGNTQLLGWALADADPRDVQIVFNNTVDDSVMKTLVGTGCYCVDFKEDWTDDKGQYEEIQIVCQVLTNGPVTFENPWK